MCEEGTCDMELVLTFEASESSVPCDHVQAGFDLKDGSPHIVPILLGDSALANDMAKRMLKRGIYVVSHAYPVVPKGQAGIRVQISAAHSRSHLNHAIDAFKAVGREFGVLE